VCDGVGDRILMLHLKARTMILFSARDDRVRNIIIAARLLRDGLRATGADLIMCDVVYNRAFVLIRKAVAMILDTTLDNGIRLFRMDRILALGTNLLLKSRSGRCPSREKCARDLFDRGATIRTEFTVLARSTV